jgi:hypothetical protein
VTLTADARAVIRQARDEARRQLLGVDEDGRLHLHEGGGRGRRPSAAVIGLSTDDGVPEVSLLRV